MNKFNVGEKVRVKPGFSSGSGPECKTYSINDILDLQDYHTSGYPLYAGGGYGYRENLILEIVQVSKISYPVKRLDFDLNMVPVYKEEMTFAYFFKDWTNGMYEFALEGIDVVREEKINKILE
jgi:hypothetical protein